ncbi:MAG: class I SAM-dependent methyltransferase [Raineya sp.]|jgi:ubiquinone/menaquinone biosynthesis C-methylase UbiE|nr:class I SAM-dependent methyltransferase [Raineya sp.]
MELLQDKTLTEGVYYLSEKQQNFESIYLKVREKENRVYSDTELSQIPFVNEYFPNYEEWLLRQESAKRFLDYILGLKNQMVLEIGCGNGWLLNYLATNAPNNTFIGLDMNALELEQAARVFSNQHLYWVYGDIYKSIFPPKSFHIIYIASSIQYFANLNEFIDKISILLKPKGEIHIFDSPFYKTEQKEEAKLRTTQYYTELGSPEMTKHYHHHTWETLKKNEYRILYKPTKWKSWLNISHSPFPWIKIIS